MRTVFLYGLASIGAVALMGGVGYSAWQFVGDWNGNDTFTTTTVSEGTVTRTIALTGVSNNRARTDLAFSTSGRVEQILVAEGDEVRAGDVLARLAPQGRDDAVRSAEASLQEAVAAQQELLRGLTDDDRQVLEITVANARDALEQTTREQDRAVESALRTLLNSTLAAFPVDQEERTPVPNITGTYECTESGIYQLEVFRSSAESGFSVRVSGLEQDTIPVSFTQGVPFGTCGLRIQFEESALYNRTKWTVPVPNTSAPNFTTNRNAYEIAQTNRESRLESAAAQLRLAEQQRIRDTAPTRSERIAQADARIAQAESQLQQARKALADSVLIAPADGVIGSIQVVVGELVSGTPAITLARSEVTHTIDVRIPEIDIADVAVGQAAAVVFDARSTETYNGNISRISPLPTEIDGVSYFTASVTLSEEPSFLRSGLNADVDIVTTELIGVATVPIVALSEDANKAFLRVIEAEGYREQPITILLQGTGGTVAIDGVPIGTEVIIDF